MYFFDFTQIILISNFHLLLIINVKVKLFKVKVDTEPIIKLGLPKIWTECLYYIKWFESLKTLVEEFQSVLHFIQRWHNLHVCKLYPFTNLIDSTCIRRGCSQVRFIFTKKQGRKYIQTYYHKISLFIDDKNPNFTYEWTVL